MGNTLGKSILIISVLILTACSKKHGDLIIGSWSCNGSSDGMNLSGDVQYLEDGKTTQTADLEVFESGNKLSLSFIAHGSWSIRKMELFESIENITITSFVVNGQNIPASEFSTEMKNDLIGASQTSEIIQLDNSVFVSKTGSGHVVTCSRQ